MRLECGCPAEYPDWDAKDLDLSNQLVHILNLPMFLHMPLAYTAYLNRQFSEISNLELTEKWPGLILTQTGFFRGRILSLLESEQTLSRHVKSLPMPFNLHGMLHNGGIDTMRKSALQLQAKLFDIGKMPKELYICHLTCLRCADERGGDKILLLRRWVESPTLKKRL